MILQVDDSPLSPGPSLLPSRLQDLSLTSTFFESKKLGTWRMGSHLVVNNHGDRCCPLNGVVVIPLPSMAALYGKNK